MRHPVLSQMNLTEKIDLLIGADFWRSVSFPHHAIPAMTVADGPHGLRYQGVGGDAHAIHTAYPATCFPTSAALGCSWDVHLVGEIAAAIAEEACAQGVDVVLGPGINIKRSPLCGRNFEYYSEDPYLTGKLGTAFVKQMQKKGIGACPKHFAANSQEYKRFSSDSILDERTFREIYLAAFETVVREANPRMIMCAYNKINGTYCSDNRWLLTDVLRNEWGFSGLVVTDWGAMHDPAAAIRAGCDWAMPGGTQHLQKRIHQEISRGTLLESDVDICVDRLLDCVQSFVAKPAPVKIDLTLHHELAYKAAIQSAVLLKNDGILPLKSSKIALIGHMAMAPRYQGSGSSYIQPTRLVSAIQAAPSWSFVPGCDAYGETSPMLLREARAAAQDADVAVCFVGLPATDESEGFDRDHLGMPEGQLRLLETVLQVNQHVVVVLFGGSPMLLPWFDRVQAVLYMALPGQAGGQAAIDLLTGLENPSGKLAETWPLAEGDVPCSRCYSAPHKDALYQEGIYVGYRYYESANAPVLFPFGYGLSYTQFAYSDLCIHEQIVSVTVQNIGAREGAEIVQLYVAPERGGLYRPTKELRGFQKVFLLPGEFAKLDFALDSRCFSIWQDGWQQVGGLYEIQIAASVRDVRLTTVVEQTDAILPAPPWQVQSWYHTLSGYPTDADFSLLLGRSFSPAPEATKGSYTMENTLLELSQHSLILKAVIWVMCRILKKMYGARKDARNPQYRMAYFSSIDCALFGLVNSSGGKISEKVALMCLDIANGKIIRAISRLLRR